MKQHSSYLRHSSHLGLLAVTTLIQHLHASAMVSLNCACEEEPSSTFNTLIPNGSLREGRGWWCPAPPARACLLHLHPPAGRACAPIPPHQHTSPVGQQRRPRTPSIQTMALGHCTGCTVLVVSRSPHLLWPEQKRASHLVTNRHGASLGLA